MSSGKKNRKRNCRVAKNKHLNGPALSLHMVRTGTSFTVWPLFKMAGLWRPVVEKASFVNVFCSSHEKEKTLRAGVVGRFRRRNELESVKRNLGSENGRAVCKVPNSILVQKMSSRAPGRLKKRTRDCTIRKLPGAFSREYQRSMLRSSLIRLLVLATSWPPTEDLHAQNLSRFRVAKYASFVFFLL